MSDSLQPHGLYVACQSSLFMGFPWQEYWRGLPFPSLGGLPDPGIELRSPALQADSLSFEPPGKPTNHISNAQQPQVVSGYPTEQHRYRIFSALQRVLLVMLL